MHQHKRQQHSNLWRNAPHKLLKRRPFAKQKPDTGCGSICSTSPPALAFSGSIPSGNDVQTGFSGMVYQGKENKTAQQPNGNSF
jgi:hypothetical protein